MARPELQLGCQPSERWLYVRNDLEDVGPRKALWNITAPPLGQDMDTGCPEAGQHLGTQCLAGVCLLSASFPQLLLVYFFPEYTTGIPKVRQSSTLEEDQRTQNSDLQLHEE